MTTNKVAYPHVRMFVGGNWVNAQNDGTGDVINPATEEVVGTFAYASVADLDEALSSADRGFSLWSQISAFERGKIMRTAAELLRSRVNDIAPLMTTEQGKPIAESRGEVMAAADIIEWFAEEAKRAYGRIVPSRSPFVQQLVTKEPIGPVAAFTPWNFPINQAVRKISAALAAGCSIIVKGPEETPASTAELVKAFADAGLPDGAVNLVFGNPAEISSYLIAHPVIKKISFTGSTPVGKQLAALAGTHMKRATMELGGHAPVAILKDADVAAAASIMAAAKFRNAGQVCVSPTRFLIEEDVYDEFVSAFADVAKAVKVGNGLEDGVTMGALANGRRIEAIDTLVQDAVKHGAELVTGGKRVGNKGYFFEPTVLSRVPTDARAMNEEPFGPVALMVPMSSVDEILEEANRLNYGLASYAFTRSAESAAKLSKGIRAGMLSMNHYGLALPEVPFGGINDSGYGTEGGADALEPYLNTKFVTQLS